MYSGGMHLHGQEDNNLYSTLICDLRMVEGSEGVEGVAAERIWRAPRLLCVIAASLRTEVRLRCHHHGFEKQKKLRAECKLTN